MLRNGRAGGGEGHPRYTTLPADEWGIPGPCSPPYRAAAFGCMDVFCGQGYLQRLLGTGYGRLGGEAGPGKSRWKERRVGVSGTERAWGGTWPDRHSNRLIAARVRYWAGTRDGVERAITAGFRD